jgi:hypothetical protein
MQAYIKKAIATAGMSDCNSVSTPMEAGFQLNKTMGPATNEDKNAVLHQVNKLFYTALMQQFGHLLSSWSDAVNFYAQHVSTIGWISKQVGVTLTLAHSILGRAMSCPCLLAFQAIKRIYRFLQGHVDLSVVFQPEQRLTWGTDFVSFSMQSDASFADDQSDSHSQGGYTGHINGMAPCYWSSTKSQRVLTSTTHAETYHACKAAKQSVYVIQLLQFLGVYDNKPALLELDSLSTVRTSGSLIRKFNARQKHFHIDDRFLMQCVEDRLICTVHVSGSPDDAMTTRGFPADILTKPLGSALFKHYFQFLQGRPN